MFDEKTSLHPTAPLCPFFAPTRRLLGKRPLLTPQIRRLAVLAIRYEDKVQHTNVDWVVPLSIEFTFWNHIEQYAPETLARTMTNDISLADLLDADTQHIRRITRQWSCLRNDTATFVASDSGLFPYMAKLAEVR